MSLWSGTDSDQDALEVYSGRNRTGSKGLAVESKSAPDAPSWDTVARETDAYSAIAVGSHRPKVLATSHF